MNTAKTLKKLIFSLLTAAGLTAVVMYIGSINAYAKSSITSDLLPYGENLYYAYMPTPAAMVSFFLAVTLIVFIALSVKDTIRQYRSSRENKEEKTYSHSA